jgi:hypothetical protein
MPTPTIKAIETRYRGHRFRSRLEARWAVVLDHIGIEWQYEPEGYNLGKAGCYLPDFWLPNLNTFLEIKPVHPSPEERKKFQALLTHKQAYGAWGFDLNCDIPDWHWFPKAPIDEANEVSWFDDYGPNPWPDNLPPAPERHMLDHVPSNEDLEMVCPICGSNFVHVSDPVTLNDDYPHDVCGLRGPIHVFKARSELCHHHWDLIVAFHKGNTQVAVTIKAHGQVTPLEAIVSHFYPGTPRLLFLKAISAGKSARFEHGESP